MAALAIVRRYAYLGDGVGSRRYDAVPPRNPTVKEEESMKYTVMSSPVGPLFIAGDEAGLHFILFGSGKRPAKPEREWQESECQVVRETVRQLQAYFDRKLTRFDLPLRPSGTLFQLTVWREL